MKLWEKLGVVGVLLIWLLNPPTFVLDFAGRTEGGLFPVVSRMNLISVSEAREGWVEITGGMDKHRPCNFEEIRWYRGEPGANVRVQVVFTEASKRRPVGSFTFGPWDIQLTKDDIRLIEGQSHANSYADVYHDCPVVLINPIVIGGVKIPSLQISRPWFTITRIFPGTQSPGAFD